RHRPGLRRWQRLDAPNSTAWAVVHPRAVERQRPPSLPGTQLAGSFRCAKLNSARYHLCSVTFLVFLPAATRAWFVAADLTSVGHGLRLARTFSSHKLERRHLAILLLLDVAGDVEDSTLCSFTGRGDGRQLGLRLGRAHVFVIVVFRFRIRKREARSLNKKEKK